MRKILILVNHEMTIYNFRKELVVKLIQEGYQLYLSFPYGEKIEFLKKMGVQYFDTPIDRRGIKPLQEIKLVCRYIDIIKKVRPDIVLTYTIKPNIYGGLLCRFFHIDYFPNITGLGTSLENKGALAKIITNLYKLSLRNAACIFFQNKANLQWAQERGMVKGHFRLLPGSGVNLERFQFWEYPEENRGITFLYLGRLMRDKGIEELITAATNITKKYSYVKFYFAGELEKEYSERFQKNLDTSSISYLGFQSNVQNLIRDCSAVILPSYHEGMANVLLEAAACGRPILASHIPGCDEIFEEEITGLGFRPKDPKDLEQTLEKFILLPYEIKQQMGIYGRKKMEREFDRNIVINAYLEEIERRYKEDKKVGSLSL